MVLLPFLGDQTSTLEAPAAVAAIVRERTPGREERPFLRKARSASPFPAREPRRPVVPGRAGNTLPAEDARSGGYGVERCGEARLRFGVSPPVG